MPPYPTTSCALAGELTIYTVAELYPQCRTWIDTQAQHTQQPSSGSSPCLYVDGQAVSEVDAAGVQLLLSLSNTLQSRQSQLVLVEASASLRGAITSLGVTGLLAGSDLKGQKP